MKMTKMMSILQAICLVAVTSVGCYAIFRFAELTDAAWYVLLNPDYSCDAVPINKDLP